MFQHRVSSADNILSQAMRMTDLDRLLPMSYTMGGTLPTGTAANGNGKDRRNDGVNAVGNLSNVAGVSAAAAGNVCGYDPTAMFSLTTGDINNQPTPFVILPRADLEYLKQEVASLKNSMAEFQSVVNCEMQKLRMESQTLKQQVEGQNCVCKDDKTNGSLSAKTAGWDGNGSYGQTVDMSAIGCGTSEQATPDAATPSSFTSITPLSTSGSLPAYSMSNTSQSDCQSMSVDNKPLTQLLPNYDVYVNKLSLQIIINEAQQHKENGALFVLRRIIPLVFSWEELACSRGQGLNCKSTDDVNTRFPLDPTRVMACKAFMRKFCMEYGAMEPPEKTVNQTFNHQVNYARRRVRGPRLKAALPDTVAGGEAMQVEYKTPRRAPQQHSATCVHRNAGVTAAQQQQCKVLDRTNKFMQ